MCLINISSCKEGLMFRLEVLETKCNYTTRFTIISNALILKVKIYVDLLAI